MPTTLNKPQRKKRRHQEIDVVPTDKNETQATPVTPWHQTNWGLGAIATVGGILLWAAFPPLGFWPLAFVAPGVWCYLVRQTTLPGKRPYLVLYGASLIHWLFMLRWVCLPHWSAPFGCALLVLYLGCYLPLFIGLSRTCVHRLRIPLIIAVPVVWVGLEYARAYVATGFSLSLLGHSQVNQLPLLQISDLFGAYAVSFVVILVAACFAKMVPCGDQRWKFWPIAPAVAVVAATLCYGQWRLGEETKATGDDRTAQVALIQGKIDTQFDGKDHRNETVVMYHSLSMDAREAHRNLDLLIWPESMFPFPLIEYQDEKDVVAPDYYDVSDAEMLAAMKARKRQYEDYSKRITEARNGLPAVPILVGGEAFVFDSKGPSRRATAALLSDTGEVEMHYEKTHPVMFGEYVPLGDVFPWLYKLTPMEAGLTRGTKPHAIEVNGLRLSPSICFENTVPQLIHRHVRELRQQGEEPDVLVTITNDGWFWGSELLDIHLACGVFRAIEHRKPMLIAANTGFSAVIDGNGRVQEKGPRRDSAFLVSNIQADKRSTLYGTIGDWPAAICLLLCIVVGLGGTTLTVGKNVGLEA